MLGFLYAFRYYSLNQIRLENDLEIERHEHKKAEELNRVKLQFFTQISHEFRTPLSLIIGPVNELINLDKQFKWMAAAKQLKMIDFNARHLLRLIDQLLYFSKSEQGKMKFDPNDGDLIPFVSQICDSFSYLARKNKVHLQLNAVDKSIKAQLDWDKMEKILNNLLSNALKFTPPNGNIEVRVCRKPVSGSDSQPSSNFKLVIEIHNTGAFIPEEHLSRIFESFYQVTSDRDSLPIGYGIGLALTKRLVEMHKGEIAVKSNEEAGTTFTMIIPHITLSTKEKSIHKNVLGNWTYVERDSQQSEVETFIPPKKIDPAQQPLVLIVDDNVALLSYLKSILIKDYQIIEAHMVKWAGRKHLPMSLI